MTVYKSGLITDRDTQGKQIDRQASGAVKQAIAPVTLPGAIADNDVIALCELPIEARITSIRHWSDDLGTTGTLNLGFYPANKTTTGLTDADAIDEDALATAVDVNAAALADVELRYEVKDINTADQAVWELAGLSSKPDYGKVILAFTAAAATTAGGDITVVVSYID